MNAKMKGLKVGAAKGDKKTAYVTFYICLESLYSVNSIFARLKDFCEFSMYSVGSVCIL